MEYASSVWRISSHLSATWRRMQMLFQANCLARRNGMREENGFKCLLKQENFFSLSKRPSTAKCKQTSLAAYTKVYLKHQPTKLHTHTVLCAIHVFVLWSRAAVSFWCHNFASQKGSRLGSGEVQHEAHFYCVQKYCSHEGSMSLGLSFWE